MTTLIELKDEKGEWAILSKITGLGREINQVFLQSTNIRKDGPGFIVNIQNSDTERDLNWSVTGKPNLQQVIDYLTQGQDYHPIKFIYRDN